MGRASESAVKGLQHLLDLGESCTRCAGLCGENPGAFLGTYILSTTNGIAY